MKEKVLFLDFDGVLFDTLKEVYLVNRQLYQGIGLFDEIDIKNYQLYSKYKYLVYNIWMFYYYNPLLFDNCDDIENKFSQVLLNRNLKAEEEFCAEFLKIRADLVKNNYDFWNNLETPYDFFFEIKKLYEQKALEIVVVSKKNKTAIAQRFASFGWNLPEDKIFAREVLDKYSTKGEFLCIAKRVQKVHPMANVLGTVKDMEEYKQQYKKQQQIKNRLIKTVKKTFAPEELEVLEIEHEPIQEIEKIEQPKPKRERKLTPREQQMNRPLFASNFEKYEWLMSNGCTNSEDRKWLTDYIRSDEYMNLYGD